ncbi:MAG TPA: hypothetical protein VFZ52_21265 [Chryseolinea sp.]
MKVTLNCLSFLIAVHLVSYAQKQDQSKYLGQPQPGNTATVFAPGLVSLKDRYEFGSTFSPDGKEFYFATEVDKKPEIWFATLENDSWTAPKKLMTHERYGYNDPLLSPDGRRLFFISDRALNGNGDKKDIDIWFIERTKTGWSEPVNAGPEINTDKNEYYISFTNRGTMYFASNGGTTASNDKNFDIRSAELIDGQFQPSRKLSGAINTEHYEGDVYISPDETYIIYCSERPNNKGKGDLYISFKNAKGDWMPSKLMESISTEAYEFCPFVTHDQKFLFFSRSGEIFWVSIKIIDQYR